MVINRLDDRLEGRRLFLMRFELGDRHVVLRPTFRTADPQGILKHIHLPNRQGVSMGAHTSLERHEPIRLRRIRFR
jgi:hypothetical protein